MRLTSNRNALTASSAPCVTTPSASAAGISRSGKATLLLVLVVVPLGLGLLIGEGLLRIREVRRESVPGTMPLLYYQHARLGHALVRGYNYFDWVHVNGQGMRGPEVSVAKPAGVTRVMAVGASTTFDGFVSRDDRTWPARLAERLRQLVPGQRIEVINAGVSGYRVMDNVIRLQTELFAYDPDVIILYHAHNDLFSALRRKATGDAGAASARPDAIDTVTPWGSWLAGHSLLYTKVLARWKALGFRRLTPPAKEQSGAATPPLEATLGDGAAQFERDLRFFITAARSLGIPVVMAPVVMVNDPAAAEVEPESLRNWRLTVPFASPELVFAGYRRYNATIRRVAHEFSAPLIDTERFGIIGRSLYSDGDPIHFNDAGAAIMGRGMADALLASGVLSASMTLAARPSAVSTDVRRVTPAGGAGAVSGR